MNTEDLGGRIGSFLQTEMRRTGSQLSRAMRKTGEEPVHEARKSIKKLRAGLRLAGAMADETALARVSQSLREAAHRLGPLRDGSVLRQTIDGLKKPGEPGPPPPATPPPLPLLRQSRKCVRDADSALRTMLRSGLDSAKVKTGLRRIYRRARKAMLAAKKSRSDEDLHAWRRRAKDLVYSLEIITSGGEPSALWKRVKRLTTALGKDHDLAFFEQQFRSAAEHRAHARLFRRARQRRRDLQKKAFRKARQVFRPGAHAFVRRLLA